MSRFSTYLYQVHKPQGPRGSSVILCKKHRELSRSIAAEGTVLLKNNGLLPLAPGTRICPFGNGMGNFLFGGGGSGWVISDRLISLADALREESQLEVFTPLLDFYRDEAVPDQGTLTVHEQLVNAGLLPCPTLPENLYRRAVDFGGVALLCISRYSTESSLFDRSGSQGDFLLWPQEQALFDRLEQDFSQVLVVLNVCGPVAVGRFRRSDRVGAIIYPMFGGNYAGQVITDILLGRSYPSGHLVDTLAETVEDYPSTASFRESPDYVPYEEDIYVGYRYFETLAPEKVVYPFGYGLSYTEFSLTCQDAFFDGRHVQLSLRVVNVGKRPGKEVAQVYLTAPQGKLGKAKKILTAFRKTPELAPGEETQLRIRFDLREFGSYDDTGLVARNCFVLEQGEYTVSLGTNVRSASACLRFRLDRDQVCRRCKGYMAPRELTRRLRADGAWEALPQSPGLPHPAPVHEASGEPFTGSLAQALEADRLDDFLAGLSNEELCHLFYGHPAFHPGGTGGIGMPPIRYHDPRAIPLIPTADGPAGFRTLEQAGLHTTYFPCSNVVAQTWDPELARAMGKAGALELKETGGGIWLAPALNIHRNPMCGRNFEYYSEDPLISGVFASAFVRGVQSQGIAATVKHFCCNNKELNRRESDSRVSMRALREIYLRGFEITVKTADPWCVMTAYNRVNGVRSSANWESIQGILKGEWGYPGLVMTDWHTYSTLDQELLAGSHVKMPEERPGNVPAEEFRSTLAQALENGTVTRQTLLSAARQILLAMDHFE